jgi:hypothetical protein
MKRTPAAERAARARRQKKHIAGVIALLRHDAWESLMRTVADENPNGTVRTFERWFTEAWIAAVTRGAK